MKEKEFTDWEKMREKKVIRFTLENGLLAWGLPMFIAMAFINKPFGNGFVSKAAIVHYIAWPIAGLIFGLVLWHVSESRYKKEANKREST